MKVHCVKDLSGYVCLSLVFAYWIYGTIVPMKIILLPYYQMGVMKTHAVAFYMFFSIMTIASLIRSAFFHPGKIPTYTGSMAQADWEYCSKCNQKRPPRSHHCKRCRHCVTRMDHHCPWINNCVGEDNHFAFIQLIFYSIGLSIFAFAFCLSKSYKLPPCPSEFCSPESWFVIHERPLLIAAYIMSAIMSISMVGLSCGQHFGIALDVTTLETMISKDLVTLMLSRPERPMKHRYDILCGTKNVIKWLFPCRNRGLLITEKVFDGEDIV
ncbi:palmitoyltransferase ZDHHC21-like [Watersipora subatra]|uniref:palmitoyltransferase ZDHHC21-like n=1 Tax=Watersipora subatra TaxID=2589382 RepID=UPI00355BD392